MAKEERPGQLDLLSNGPDGLSDTPTDDDSVAKAARAAIALMGAGNVHEDLGHGNREKIKLVGLAGELEEDYKVIESFEALSKGDFPITALQTGILEMADLALAGPKVNIANHVASRVEAFAKETGSKGAAKHAAQQAELSLVLLTNAMLRDSDHFIADNPSPAWEDPTIRQALLDGIDKSVDVVMVIRPVRLPGGIEVDRIKTIESFMRDLKDEFTRAGGLKVPERGSGRSQKARFDNRRQDVRRDAKRQMTQPTSGPAPQETA